MSSKIQQTQKKSYKEILSSAISFHIPTFQRSYSWKPKQIEQLWESITTNLPHYYIGNIVVVQHSTNDIRSGYLIIDGQQRLTTLSLFLIAIRNYIAKDRDKDKSKQVIKKHKEKMDELRSYLIHSTPFSDNSVIKLSFSKKNLADVYKNLAYGEDVIFDKLDDAQKRFEKNLSYINQLIRDFVKESGSAERAIQELVNKVFDLEFIIIECKNESDVYQIFEGLNSTGLELSVVDLVKNTVLKRIKHEDKTALEKAERMWEEMENNFEASKLNLFSKFLRHQWISNYGYINTSQLYDSIRNKLDEFSENSEILGFIENLKNDSKLYLSIRTGDLEYLREYLIDPRDINFEKYLTSFQLLDSDQIFEVLLTYCKKYKQSDLYTNKQFFSDIKNLWNVGLMMKIISSVNPSKYEKLFADRCKSLTQYSGSSFNKESNKFYSSIYELIKDRKEDFIRNFNEILLYKKGNESNNSLIRFILLTMYQDENTGITYEIKTIEHIASQSKYESEDFLHKIGNLTILSKQDNGSIGDKDFSFKYEKCYSLDIFNHNKRLNDYPFETDPKKATQLRGDCLAKKAYEIFSFI